MGTLIQLSVTVKPQVEERAGRDKIPLALAAVPVISASGSKHESRSSS
jgi:hypothetical protein